MALAKLKVSEEDLATEKGPVMERHVEERFERIEKTLEETNLTLNKTNQTLNETSEHLKDARAILDSILSHLELCTVILQDTDSLSRESRKTLDGLLSERR